MRNGSNFYHLLGLARDATLDEIRSAYREAARRYHPDVNSKPGETELFMDIQQAYEVLSDPKKRADYDTEIGADKEVSAAHFEILFSHSSLMRADEPQLVYALIRISSCEEAVDASTPSLNICLVIDRSTSMQGERMDKVKDTAIELIRNLKPTDSLSIVTFSDHAEVLLPARKHMDRNTVETRIRMLQANGGTEIFRGLEAGLAEVRRSLRSNSINHIILLTDGRTYGDEQACLNLADYAAESGIGISGLGIGSQWNDAFLDDLAARTGGSSVYVSETADIERFLRQKFNNLNQAYAERVVYRAKINSEVELIYAFRIRPEASKLGTHPPLRLGSLPKNSKLEILLEFMIAPISAGVDEIILAEGRLSLDIPALPVPTSTERLNLGLPVVDIAETSDPPAEILQAMKQLTLYRMQEKAQEDIADGDYESAHRRLQHLATHLLSQGEYELASTVLNEAESLIKQESLSEAGGKQIKYGTRALIPPISSLDLY